VIMGEDGEQEGDGGHNCKGCHNLLHWSNTQRQVQRG
jgi:hypothetical protein